MAVSKDELQQVYDNLENSNYNIYFICPDFEKPSGGVGLIYDHVRVLNQNGFKAFVLHEKEGFKPSWLEHRLKMGDQDVPVRYLKSGALELSAEDFIFIPEGFPHVMQDLRKQGTPCKLVVFCQNWYYVLNALPPGVLWNNLQIDECLSVSNSQSVYLKTIMPFLKIKNVVGSVDPTIFYPPTSIEKKQPYVAYVPSRDGGVKSMNVIKTFYALFPAMRWIQFKPLVDLDFATYSETIRNAAFYCHFDEFSSWGTAPIEAFMSKTLVAGWDGVGGREYMKPIRHDTTDGNMWLAINGDIQHLVQVLVTMIETWLSDSVPDYVYTNMDIAAQNYTLEAEKDSVLMAHNEYREERMKEIQEMINSLPTEEKVEN